MNVLKFVVGVAACGRRNKYLGGNNTAVVLKVLQRAVALHKTRAIVKAIVGVGESFVDEKRGAICKISIGHAIVGGAVGGAVESEFASYVEPAVIHPQCNKRVELL